MDEQSNKNSAIEPIGGISITAIDFEYESKTLFIAESAGPNRGLYKLTLGSGEIQHIVRDSFGSFTIRSIAVDWVNC